MNDVGARVVGGQCLVVGVGGVGGLVLAMVDLGDKMRY